MMNTSSSGQQAWGWKMPLCRADGLLPNQVEYTLGENEFFKVASVPPSLREEADQGQFFQLVYPRESWPHEGQCENPYSQ